MADERYLLDLMQREAGAVERLLECLRLEEKALAERDVDTIERLTTEKQEYLAALEAFATERERLLSNAGLTADRQGFESLLEQAGGSEALTVAWEALRENLAECQEQNLKNGQILEASRRFAGDVLGILLGEKEGTETYDRTGATNQPRGNHTYAKV